MVVDPGAGPSTTLAQKVPFGLLSCSYPGYLCYSPLRGVSSTVQKRPAGEQVYFGSGAEVLAHLPEYSGLKFVVLLVWVPGKEIHSGLSLPLEGVRFLRRLPPLLTMQSPFSILILITGLDAPFLQLQTVGVESDLRSRLPGR